MKGFAYTYYDGQGTIVGFTDQTGELRTGYTYEPYGHPANLTSLGDENPFGYLGTYTAGVEDQGVLCGGPSQIDGAFYDAEDGRFTQIASPHLPPFTFSAPSVPHSLPNVRDWWSGRGDEIVRGVGKFIDLPDRLLWAESCGRSLGGWSKV